MQNSRDKLLTLRIHFYQMASGTEFLGRGMKYDKLPEFNTIVICTYDPFGYGLSRYTFKTGCIEVPEIQYNDGVTTIYLNAAGSKENLTERQGLFMDFIITNQANSDPLLCEIKEKVDEINNNESWRETLMTYDEKMAIERREAKDEGIAKGKEIGLAEGKEIGKEIGREEGKYSNMFSTVSFLVSNGSFSSEEYACAFLGYDFEDYLKGKDVLNRNSAVEINKA